MWLGAKRGHLTDWTTQQWVKTTGILTDLQFSQWLEIARPTGIEIRFFDDFAAENGLSVRSGTGLIKNLAELSGSGFKLGEVSPEVRHFYENPLNMNSMLGRSGAVSSDPSVMSWHGCLVIAYSSSTFHSLVWILAGASRAESLI